MIDFVNRMLTWAFESIVHLVNDAPQNLFNLGLLVVAIIAACISVKTYHSSNEPQIEFSLEESYINFQKSGVSAILFLKLKNTGRTPAYNLIIESTRKLDEEEEEALAFTNIIDGKIYSAINEFKENPKKILYLPSSSERWFHALDSTKVFDSELTSVFEFKIKWKKQSIVPFFKKTVRQKYIINYSDFKDSVINYENEPIASAINKNSDKLEQINKTLTSVMNKSNAYSNYMQKQRESNVEDTSKFKKSNIIDSIKGVFKK